MANHSGASNCPAHSLHAHCMQWIAASVTSFSPRNDMCVRVLTEPYTTIPFYALSSRGPRPWRSTVNREANRQLTHVTRDTMDCRFAHLRFFPVMIKSVQLNRTIIFCLIDRASPPILVWFVVRFEKGGVTFFQSLLS